jgi:hypothetical protein
MAVRLESVKLMRQLEMEGGMAVKLRLPERQDLHTA